MIIAVSMGTELVNNIEALTLVELAKFSGAVVAAHGIIFLIAAVISGFKKVVDDGTG